MLETIRELIFIIAGGILVIMLLVLTVAIFTILALVKKTKKAFNTTMNETINPALHEFQETAQNIKGTGQFMSKKTMAPVIQVLSLIKSISKGIGFFTTLGRKK
ncbi:MAG: hypothetical protein DK305_000939 [Chloroflexi bacterium]|jgi:hypothetical protein|nr:MAG: hypothetical protein DK305_000939 [Chloroflexota bacterium]